MKARKEKVNFFNLILKRLRVKINAKWSIDEWKKQEGEKVAQNEEKIEMNANILYELEVDFFNSKVSISFLFKNH